LPIDLYLSSGNVILSALSIFDRKYYIAFFNTVPRKDIANSFPYAPIWFDVAIDFPAVWEKPNQIPLLVVPVVYTNLKSFFSGLNPFKNSGSIFRMWVFICSIP
jgi:hypothetical protein